MNYSYDNVIVTKIYTSFNEYSETGQYFIDKEKINDLTWASLPDLTITK